MEEALVKQVSTLFDAKRGSNLFLEISDSWMDFFMYYESVDFCLRARTTVWTIINSPRRLSYIGGRNEVA